MNIKGLLIFSLFANLALLGAVGFLVAKKDTAPFSSASIERSEPAKPKRSLSTNSVADHALSGETNTHVPQINWRMVESDDYRKYIENLRSIGCPEETIRDIITADVNKLFDARRKEIRAASTNKFEFWKAGNMFSSMMDETKIKQKQDLAKEKKELLSTLLGVAPEEKPDMNAVIMNPLEDMLDFLPEGKQARILELMQSMQAKMMKSYKDGAPDTENRKDMQKVQKDMEAELAKILTPQEFEDYQLRLSQTSMMMRMQMASFDPNEKEFRDIFKIQKGFDDEYGAMVMNLSDDPDKMKKVKDELNNKVKEVLGAERYADYERGQDHTYQGIAKVAQREGLPKEAGIKVFDMKKTAEDEAAKVRSNGTLSTEQRTAALEAIRTETERTMGEVLGSKGMESYKKQTSAYWLRNLSPNDKSKTK